MTVSETVLRVFNRSWSYFRQGYSQFLQLPISYIGWITAIYYLAVDNLPFLKGVFPNFQIFIASSLLIVLPIAVTLGYLYFKGFFKRFYKAEQDILAEANQYSQSIIAPVSWPSVVLSLKMSYELMRELHLDIKKETDAYRDQLIASVKHFKKEPRTVLGDMMPV